MIIEIKEMDRGRLMAKLCVDLIRRYDMMDRCCVASFNPMSIYFVFIYTFRQSLCILDCFIYHKIRFDDQVRRYDQQIETLLFFRDRMLYCASQQTIEPVPWWVCPFNFVIYSLLLFYLTNGTIAWHICVLFIFLCSQTFFIKFFKQVSKVAWLLDPIITYTFIHILPYALGNLHSAAHETVIYEDRIDSFL